MLKGKTDPCNSSQYVKQFYRQHTPKRYSNLEISFSLILLLKWKKKKRKKKYRWLWCCLPQETFWAFSNKTGGNPSLPLCLLASNHINMKWGCFWVLTQCHWWEHSHKYFQDAVLNWAGRWGKATSVLERNSFLLQPLSKLHWHYAINIQKLLYPQDRFSCQ